MRYIETLLLPPGINLVLLMAALLFWNRRRLSFNLTLVSVVSLYLASISLISLPLLRLLEAYPALSAIALKESGAQAIVVLGGGRYTNAPEYGQDTVSKSSLERLNYSAWLAKTTELPVLVAGGARHGTPEAVAMKQILEETYGLKNVIMESASRNTHENAVNSKKILDQLNYKKVFLVTHAWHMRRAANAFQNAQIDVIPAPLGFSTPVNPGLAIEDLFPSSQGLNQTSLFAHELLGLIWYKVRY